MSIEKRKEVDFSSMKWLEVQSGWFLPMQFEMHIMQGCISLKDAKSMVNFFLYPCIYDELNAVVNFHVKNQDSDIDAEWFTSEFINDVKCSGIPNLRIVLKVGVLIMLIQNLDQSVGLCNGTRLIVTALTPYIIVATALSGTKSDKSVPRLSLTPPDTGLPFKFSRRQFPETVYFAMTINKNQS
ncbi:uncharacterized protein LOC130732647 [Lotus japonicus]|uniref:uncharacterized protein LOC130732647 n=1 Tax=Lotus japonicus TaxID=34305 RepID=UPI00258FB8B0|nr:uncharacterized protein LOC130732647 [Lotus japonicus]